MDDSRQLIFAWRGALDGLTYYDLFGVSPGATADEIRDAFHTFCEAFHPDGHATRSEDERDAIATIFKRGTEAYTALADDVSRAQYDAQLTASPSKRPPRVSHSPVTRRPPSRVPGAVALEETVRSPSARPFARSADDLLRKGDLRAAKLQLVMANHMDAGNEALEAALADVERKLGSPK
jgi:curved DNA-binding protein CbpA